MFRRKYNCSLPEANMWKAVWKTMWKPVNFQTIVIWFSQRFTHISHAYLTRMWNISLSVKNIWRVHETHVNVWGMLSFSHAFSHAIPHTISHILLSKVRFFFHMEFHTVFHIINHVKFSHFSNLCIIFHTHFTYHFTQHDISCDHFTLFISPHCKSDVKFCIN